MTYIPPYNSDDLTDHVLAEMDNEIAARGAAAVALDPYRIRRLIATVRAERDSAAFWRTQCRLEREVVDAFIVDVRGTFEEMGRKL